jgi:hypothetical protein
VTGDAQTSSGRGTAGVAGPGEPIDRRTELHTDSEGSCDYLAGFRVSCVAMTVSSVVAVTAEEAGAAAKREEAVVAGDIVGVAPDGAARSVAMATVAVAGSQPDSSVTYNAVPSPASTWTRHVPLLLPQRARAPCAEEHRPAVSPVAWSARS